MNDKDLRRVGKVERDLFKKLGKKTHADRIREKSDEELATWVETIAGCDLCPMLDEQCSGGEVNSRASCKHHWLEWLRQEAGE